MALTQLRARLPCKAHIARANAVELMFFELLKVEQRVVRPVRGPEQLVEWQVTHQCAARVSRHAVAKTSCELCHWETERFTFNVPQGNIDGG